MNQIRLRIKNLRMEMLKNNLDAYYISGTDPHMSEYLPDRWKTREYISGFTGSAGTIVVTQEDAGLWTDSRYFIQAEEQLKGSGIKLFKQRIPNAVEPEEWLSNKLKAASKVGFDPCSISVNNYRKLKSELDKKAIQCSETTDLLDKIWSDRTEIPDNPVFELNVKLTGYSRKEKKELLLTELKKEGADLQVITALDELAWLFNLRGSDISYNPVFTGFGIISRAESILFTDSKKIPEDVFLHLAKDRIEIREYDEFYSWLKGIKNKTVLLDASSANYAVFKNLQDENRVKEGTSKAALLKAQKNEAELSGFKTAMKKDGAALVEFLYWLKNEIETSEIDEYTAGLKLSGFRAQQENFIDESFSPIFGYKSHGAVVHYSATPENAFKLEKDGILLFDSGGQYLEGTTDITRTIALGKPTEKQKTDFTLVLKGMIALTNAKFPQGTKGCNIDILARQALWQNGLNYGHGTGHGVGHFLNVHEGPASIRQEYNPVELKPGMVFSNEPGMYREGEYGIRIENLIVCVQKEKTDFGDFLGFETLTLFPIDTSLIKNELLTNEEINWLNDYHQKVFKELKPSLTKNLQVFLAELTESV
ncbi:MAG: aminopeptidase P family protein [Prolixibacteraceae bacterium]